MKLRHSRTEAARATTARSKAARGKPARTKSARAATASAASPASMQARPLRADLIHAKPALKAARNAPTSVSGKCAKCFKSICCSYITEIINTPRSKEDFDHLLWQVSHEHVSIYKEDGDWYLLVEGRCHHLQADGGCGIYDTRPQVCRDYSNDFCEYDQPAEEGFELYFKDYSALLEYCKKRFKRWGMR